MIRDEKFYIAKQRGLGDILLLSHVVANTSTADIRCVLRGVDIRPAVGLIDGRRRRATSLSYTRYMAGITGNWSGNCHMRRSSRTIQSVTFITSSTNKELTYVCNNYWLIQLW